MRRIPTKMPPFFLKMPSSRVSGQRRLENLRIFSPKLHIFPVGKELFLFVFLLNQSGIIPTD
jgi:hypothetical protein